MRQLQVEGLVLRRNGSRQQGERAGRGK